MTTLHVSCGMDGALGGLAVPLRHWLDGRWAILLSHPDDFVECDFELDRWLSVVGDALSAARLRLLALARRGQPVEHGWVSRLAGDPCIVSLHEHGGGSRVADLRAHRLEAAIARVPRRFAMIIDATLRLRFTWTYAAAEPPPSPLVLARLAVRLRHASEGSVRDWQSAAVGAASEVESPAPSSCFSAPDPIEAGFPIAG